ncbi:isocitrate dehydrogenase [NAD] subunit beta, mitochondrial [Lepeophtheirus salmonis]|uniref:Isocitrate dehydrogenase [NAD] subunit, mitochondrial n=2 Tax=Lepeophtheirus salmonis TaxID=72036 RepID=C1BTW3_LEPSM|nr:isocitrate dehydrogenase [NAD] subunit beta, mitochondrial-like [Lepeophtheirus salmonis]XP_040576033.1 isocitrate dehydrogenase [NAD] subunit beta, mitochondrial-like [Lepeophtheirus salmonis]XP_040576034.1 isocitrate dehydrogenase [NAD] subunit beta, mitochondrial-like [Lepeophtheirus salmonis]ACO12466.1 Isocitrate dehydrogenase subunit beta, mitochondrial precursor [Lepeophtheirus salmonis]
MSASIFMRSIGSLAHHSKLLHTSSKLSSLNVTNGRINCTMIPGDGVGPEIMDSVIRVVSATGAPINFETLQLSEVQHETSASLSDVCESVRKNGICIKGVIAVPEVNFEGDLQNLNQNFRNELDLYANVVKIRSLRGVKTRHSNLDMVIIREQTEGEYSALEHESIKGVVECLKVVTAEKSKRIAKFAFDYATRHGRKKITAVHKANIMKLGDGLFIRSCEEIAELYPNIEFEKMIVDNTTMQLVSKPHQFDVMVMPNLYGNIIDNLAAGLVGGAGLVAAASYSSEVAVFEPGARHTFDEGVGRNVANPTAILLSTAKLLEHVGLDKHGAKIKEGVERVLKSEKVRTRDLGGYSSTNDFTSAVIANLR